MGEYVLVLTLLGGILIGIGACLFAAVAAFIIVEYYDAEVSETWRRFLQDKD